MSSASRATLPFKRSTTFFPDLTSQVLNEHLGVSFYGYVNGPRVADAGERLMAEPTATILSIALDAGFNSNSTFDAASKKATGVTQPAWRAATLPRKRHATQNPGSTSLYAQC